MSASRVLPNSQSNNDKNLNGFRGIGRGTAVKPKVSPTSTAGEAINTRSFDKETVGELTRKLRQRERYIRELQSLVVAERSRQKRETEKLASLFAEMHKKGEHIMFVEAENRSLRWQINKLTWLTRKCQCEGPIFDPIEACMPEWPKMIADLPENDEMFAKDLLPRSVNKMKRFS